jgi:opacity protein-like surface antigen
MKRMIALLAGTMLASGLAHAADPVLVVDQQQFEARYEAKPAVSGINGKIEAIYGWYDIDGAGDDINLLAGAGAISVPITNAFGLQVDGALGRYSGAGDATGYGVGAHLFWRNPDLALVGLYGDYQRVSDFDVTTWRLGVEAELYLDRISLEGFAGAERVDFAVGDETYFSGEAIAALYLTDDFRIHAGAGHRFDELFGIVGAEAMLPFGANNIALFTDGTFSEDATSVRAGVRVYFGEAGKSLKARHREDDPKIRLLDPIPAGAFANQGDPLDQFIPPDAECEFGSTLRDGCLRPPLVPI